MKHMTDNSNVFLFISVNYTAFQLYIYVMR